VLACQKRLTRTQVKYHLSALSARRSCKKIFCCDDFSRSALKTTRRLKHYFGCSSPHPRCASAAPARRQNDKRSYRQPPSCLRAYVPTYLRAYVPTCLRAFVPSYLSMICKFVTFQRCATACECPGCALYCGRVCRGCPQSAVGFLFNARSACICTRLVNRAQPIGRCAQVSNINEPKTDRR